MEPRNRFQGMNSASLCSRAGEYYNPILTRFLAPIDCLQIPALMSSVGNHMGAKNQVGIGLSYQPASLCSLATQFQTRFLEPIPRPIAGLKFSTLFPLAEMHTYWSSSLGRSVPSSLIRSLMLYLRRRSTAKRSSFHHHMQKWEILSQKVIDPSLIDMAIWWICHNRNYLMV